MSSHPPGTLDRLASGLTGHGLPLALVAYRSGLLQTYAAICLIAVVVAAVVPRWRARVAFAVAALLLAWVASDFFKGLFERARPEHWELVRETSYSYSSGHATLSLVVYGLWAFYLWRSRLPEPLRIVAAVALGGWCLVVVWSRLAMGAHFPTDILGGWLLGLGVLAALRALLDTFADVRLTARPAAQPPT